MASDSDNLVVAKPSRWKKWLRRATIIVSAGIVALAFLVRNHVRTLNSLRKIPRTNAYVMDYYCDYHLEEIRSGGVKVSDVESSYIKAFFPDIFLPVITLIKRAYIPREIETSTPVTGHHCSTVALTNQAGEVFLGRNFDWYHDAFLIIRIHDRDGVASIAVLDLEYLNMDRSDLDGTSIIERLPLLFSPYYMMDGMNRHGVAVSSMAVNADPPRETGKPAIIIHTLMRVILDYAKDAEEAVDLIREFNVYFGNENQYYGSHLLIADSSGDFRVIEFIDGEIRVTSSQGRWQVCTNHVIWNKTEQENDKASRRYRIGSDLAEKLDDLLQYNDALQVTRSMAVEGFTMWTSVYNLTTGEARILYKSKLEREYRDALVR